MTSRSRSVELIEAAAILVIAGFFYAMTWSFVDPPVVDERALRPTTFPRLILGAIMLLGVVRALTALQTPANLTMELPWDRVVLATAVLSLVYAIAARYLGVFLPTPFYIVALAWLWGARSPLYLFIIAFGVPLAVWLLFEVMFRSQLPLGPFSG